MLGNCPSRIRLFQRAMAQQKTTTQIVYLNSKSVKVPGMGPGESYTELGLEICTAGQLVVKDLEYGLGRVFKVGLVSDVTLHHYGVCDTYRMFGDAVLRHSPGDSCWQTMLLALYAWTVSRLSVTKASGLSNTTGAERSTGGEIVVPWHSPLDSCRHPRRHFIEVAGMDIKQQNV